jgi:CarboxypepD_reg-like domain/Gram-negative bacterial TonB protein C-terminal
MPSPSDNQPVYSRETLLRYISGQMTPAEMHVLEKAALEDPFLADAIEGLQQEESSKSKKDLETLDQRLNNRVDPKVVPMPPRIKWWRVAIVASIIGMMGLSYYLFTVRDEDLPAIAQVATNTTKDSGLNPGNEMQVPDSSAINSLSESKTSKENVNPLQSSSTADTNKVSSINKPENILPGQLSATTPQEKPPMAAADVARVSESEVEREEVAEMQSARQDKKVRAKSLQPSSIVEKGPEIYYFIGRVTDQQDKPVAFANIAIRDSRRSNYTDANGNFKLIAGDSSLEVDIKSVGYISRFARLSHSRALNKVILQSKGGSKKKLSAKTPVKTAKEISDDNERDPSLEKPDVEPRDGFAAYQFYLLNNVRLPAEAANKGLKGVVELSFLVGDNGRLSDFKIEKSLCHSCDKEAIRLIKDGPPWILYNSDLPVRARISVVF